MTASFKGKLIAGFVLAFLAGGAAGAFFTFHHARHWRAYFGRHPHSLTERMRDQIKDQLDLTPEQLAKIEPILNHATKELQDIRAETGAKVRQVMAETNRALQPELTEPQRARLEKIQKAGRDRKDLRDSSRPSRRRERAAGKADAGGQ
jgi:Spy/CpxP family protein refolding chaperone